MIKVTNLNKYFKRKRKEIVHVINNVSLELPETGLVCIIGESGSGKTTLLNTLGGLDRFKQGTIEAYGKKIKNNNIKSYENVRNNNYGYIFQNFYLLDQESVYSNIKICLNMYDLSDDEKDKRINIALKAVGMERYKKRIISQLSGGQQQRIAIARALVKSPNVIFADEPTGNLDEANTLNIMNILKKVSKNCLVVIVTHEKNIADFFADRIIEIGDGKILSDTILNSNTEYEYTNNDNIYLKEYRKEIIEDSNTKYQYYVDDNKKENKKLNLNIIYKDNKYYIVSQDNSNIELLTEHSKIKMIDKYKPKLKLSNVQDTLTYNLDKIKQNKQPTLTVKELFKLAKNNIQMYGKKKFFLIISLLLVSVLSTLIANNFYVVNSIKIDSYKKFDSHYETLSIDKYSMIGNEKYNLIYDIIYDYFFDKYSNNLYYSNIPKLYIKDTGYTQTNEVKITLKHFSVIPLKYLKKDQLIYGNMPTNINEIIIDKITANNLLEQNSLAKTFYKDITGLLNEEFLIKENSYPYKIVGICDTNESSIYIDKLQGLGLVTSYNQVISFSTIKKLYPDEFKNLELKDNEIIISNNIDNVHFLNKTLTKFKICKIQLPKELTNLVIVNKNNYKQLLKEVCRTNKKINFYHVNTNNLVNIDKDIDLIYKMTQKNNKMPFKELINITTKFSYYDNILKYKNDKQLKVNETLIIFMLSIISCIIILYFIMKSNAIQNIKTIAVYRLIGIKKVSITLLYVFQNIIISTYSTLVGVLTTSFILKFFANIPSLQIKSVIPWYLVVCIIIVLYLVNIFIGLLPITSILKLMPAQITSKYDM